MPRIHTIHGMFLLWLLSSPLAGADAQQTGTIRAGQSDSVGFQHVWREILTEADIEHTFIEAPGARKRRLFIEGNILLDCCAAPQWRTQPKEVAAQLWSDTFYITKEQFLFRKDKAFPVTTPQDLQKLRVATVRGFEYEDSQYFGLAVTGRDTKDTFRLLNAGRADVGIVSNIDFLMLADTVPGDFMLGPVRVQAPQKVRVHKSIGHLLEPINAAIRRLKTKGKITQILERKPAPQP